METTPEISDEYFRRLHREAATLEAETRRWKAEADKLLAERMVAGAREDWLGRLSHRPAMFMLFTLVLAIAIMGLGAAPVIIFSR